MHHSLISNENFPGSYKGVSGKLQYEPVLTDGRSSFKISKKVCRQEEGRWKIKGRKDVHKA